MYFSVVSADNLIMGEVVFVAKPYIINNHLRNGVVKEWAPGLAKVWGSLGNPFKA